MAKEKFNKFKSTDAPMHLASFKIVFSMALFAVLYAISNPTSAQIVLKKKDIETIQDSAEASQSQIWEDMARILFGWWLEDMIKTKIEKQNSDNPDNTNNWEESLFKDPDVKKMDVASDSILSKNKMQEIIYAMIDSTATEDFSRFYRAFHDYQKAWENLVWHKNGKWDMWSGWNLLPFPVQIDIDYLKNNNLPYSKEDLKKLESDFEKYYNDAFTKWQSEALTDRQSENPQDYESSDLNALEKQRQLFVKNVYEKYVKVMIDKVFKQYYSNGKDASKKQEKSWFKKVF